MPMKRKGDSSAGKMSDVEPTCFAFFFVGVSFMALISHENAMAPFKPAHERSNQRHNVESSRKSSPTDGDSTPAGLPPYYGDISVVDKVSLQGSGTR